MYYELAGLRVVQTDLQDTIWMIFVLKMISKLCSAENNAYKSEEATGARSHWAVLCLSSQKYISMTLNVTHYFHWQVAMET